MRSPLFVLIRFCIVLLIEKVFIILFPISVFVINLIIHHYALCHKYSKKGAERLSKKEKTSLN